MRTRFLTLVGLALCASPLLGSGKSFLGQVPPKIQPEDFINRPERTEVSDYQGELLLLEFFATW